MPKKKKKNPSLRSELNTLFSIVRFLVRGIQHEFDYYKSKIEDLEKKVEELQKKSKQK